MQIQSYIREQNEAIVVICFKFSNFAYANTVDLLEDQVSDVLLFALNLVTLLMQIQSKELFPCADARCYLL